MYIIMIEFKKFLILYNTIYIIYTEKKSAMKNIFFTLKYFVSNFLIFVNYFFNL